VVRVWELPGEELLQGPLGAAMLGLLTEQVQGRVEDWTRRFIRRVEQEGVGPVVGDGVVGRGLHFAGVVV